VYLLDTGLMNSLLNSFQPVGERLNKGEIWETACYKMLYERYNQDEIHYWRTTDDNEVDFVLPLVESPFAIEIKYDKNGIRESKYRKFAETYPDIPLRYNYLHPFDEDFFRRNS
jgi:predicted AAA+ superfamily ATPase